MFHQVLVTECDQHYLRFLWWDNGDLSSEPQKYCVTRHIFGATSSPSCASYCLQRTAHDHADDYPPEVIQSVLQNFYVDDFLKSTPDVASAVQMIPQVTALLGTGSFNLTKFLSNSHQVLLTIPKEKKAPSVKQHAIDHKLPFERALGIKWDVEEDAFLYTITP